MQRLLNLKNFGQMAKFHIVGIGGIGMSGIAEILHNLGYRVAGSDMSSNYNTERLEKLGVKVYIGHDAENIDGADYVVVSTSIQPSNVEYTEAKKRHIPIIKRAEMLAEIMKMKMCVSISGSHGKTSTTSMVASVFEAAGLEPTVINGGIINAKSTNAYIGMGDYMIVEADESDATFINVPSSIGIITNIDPEHLDFYKNYENLYAAFKSFIHNLPFYGFGVLCADHPATRKLASEIIDRKIITYGIKSEDCNVRAYNIKNVIDGSKFDIKISLGSNVEYTIENVHLSIPGEHNVLNCLAAVSVAAELDFGIKAIKEGLLRFKGVKRRFTKAGEVNGIRFIDDYAHHPSEIKVTLATARDVTNKENKVLAIFQPHRYSRAHLFDEFVESLSLADEVYISPIYAAGEAPVGDYSNEKFAKVLKEKFPNKEVKAVLGIEDLPEIIKRSATKGDLVLFMGAGNITSWAYEVPKILGNK